jgi:predicted ATP-dependent serine protease
MQTFSRCPECRAVRIHVDGKCQICGYISTKRASINALYPSKNTKTSRSISNSSSRSRISRSSRSSNSSDYINSSIIKDSSF